jgi:hypothetical protein
VFANGQALGVLIPWSILVVIATCTVSVVVAGIVVALSVEDPFAFLVLPFVVLLTLGVPTGKEQ